MKRCILFFFPGIFIYSSIFGQDSVIRETKLDYAKIAMLDSIHTNDQKYREKTDRIAEIYGQNAK